MLLVHGIYHFRKRKLEAREEACNRCEQLRTVELWRSFHVLHLFWIPLLPLGSYARWQCAACHADPHARYKTSRGMKIAGLVALAFFLFSLCIVEPKPDEVAFMWGARIVLAIAWLALLYSVLKRPAAPSPFNAIVGRCREVFGDVFKPASASELESLRHLRLSEPLLDFYRNFAPNQTIESDQGICLHTIAEVLEHNRDFMPGCYTARHGFVVFATNFEGDAYCFDLRGKDAPPIVLISHEMISEKTSLTDIARLAKPLAANLQGFLDKFLAGTLDEKCLSWDDMD